MAGITGIGGNQDLGLNGGIGVGQGGVQGLDNQLGLKGGPADQIKQLFEQLVKKLLEGGQQAQGGQQPQGAQQAQQGGAQQAQGGNSLQDLIEELKRKAKENPEAFAKALQSNPAFMAVAQAALSGGGGGGAIGGAK